MITSMTGFGRAVGKVADRIAVTVTSRSVNHRFLEVSVRIPEFLWDFEPSVRALAGEYFSRGKLDVSLRVQRISEPDYVIRVNRKIADTVIPQLQSIMSDFGINSAMTAGDLLRINDLLQIEPVESELTDAEREQFTAIMREAFDAMLAMRKTEGESLERDVTARIDSVASLREQLLEHRDTFVREALDNYKQRIDEIARTSGVTVDPDRLAQETVLLVERSDVAEELTRMKSHIEQIRELIASKEPAGKKLDFLSQELLREINTLGQKSKTAGIRKLVVELKTEVERIREQVQNIE